MPTEREVIAHVLRRTTFGPFPGQVDELLKVGAGATIEMALGAKPDVPADRLDGKDDYGNRMTRYWLERMLDRLLLAHGVRGAFERTFTALDRELEFIARP